MKEGWILENIGDICQIINGGTPKTNVSSYWDGDINWITPADLGKLTTKLVGSTKRKITQIGLEKSSAKLFPPNSIILSTRAPIGHLAINTTPICTNQGCRGLVPDNNRLDVWYLYYFLWNNVELLDSLGSGTTFKELSTKALSNVRLPIPPLPEQQRIVSIIDKAFEAIDKAIENTQKNLQNAKELFESYLNSVFENIGEEKKLEDLSFLISKGSSPKWQGIKYVDEPGVLFVTSENVGENELILKKRKYVEEKFNISDKKSILKNGDVLTNIVGASIGRSAIFNLDEIANINQAVCLIRCNPNLLLSEYLMYILNTPFTKKYLHDNEVNSARANLSLGFFRSLLIPTPNLIRQKEIVDEIKVFQFKTDRLKSKYQQKLANLEELKKSLLNKAFAGEL